MPVATMNAKVAKSVDALVLGASGATRESSSLSFRTCLKQRLSLRILFILLSTLKLNE